MALLIAAELNHPEDWVSALMPEVPGLDIRVWPEIGDPADIDYALAWKPKPGLLASLPNLKAILSLGAGVDGILSDPTMPRDVPLIRMVDDSLTEGMVDFVVWQVLDWHRQGPVYRGQQRKALWRPQPQALARERKAGVMGLGELGRAVAGALAALNFDVSGWSRTPRSIDGITCFHGLGQGLDHFLARSDVLVCLLPLTPDTIGVLGGKTFARLPRGAYVINAARGGHLVEADLLAALGSGQLAGATLDVFAQEPLPGDHPFWRDPRITISPHVASDTHARTAAKSIAASIRRIEAGESLAYVVDLDRGY